MKKGIEWLKEKIGDLPTTSAEFINDGLNYIDSAIPVMSIYELINQLDEPEVLSQEWIDEHATAVTYDEILDQTEIAYVDDLENLIIPKEESEVTLNRAFEKIAEAYPMTKEEVCRHLEKFVAHGGKVTYGEQEVLSQELPVVPTWFDEWWKDIPKGEGNLLHNIAQFHDKLYSSETREVGVYIEDSGNKKKLLNIIINELDYKVEEEQKYFVSSRESIGFWFLTKDNDGDIAIGTNKDYYDRKWESLKLTEEEIKDYDSRYWAFAVKVEEVEE